MAHAVASSYSILISRDEIEKVMFTESRTISQVICFSRPISQLIFLAESELVGVTSRVQLFHVLVDLDSTGRIKGRRGGNGEEREVMQSPPVS